MSTARIPDGTPRPRCGMPLTELGLNVICQLRPEHGATHWAHLDRDGVVFWWQISDQGGLAVDLSLFDAPVMEQISEPFPAAQETLL